MCTYLLYSILKIVSHATIRDNNFSPELDARLFDILSLVISISNMLMLYGVSDSIKKSVQRQIRTERLTSALDELISNSDFEESLNENDNYGAEPDDLIEKHLIKQHSKKTEALIKQDETEDPNDTFVSGDQQMKKIINGSQVYINT